MPRPTIVEIPPAEQARMRAELRRARYGYLLALHLLLLCAAGRTPSEVASVLFCSRSSVYRIVRAYRAGTLTLRGGNRARPAAETAAAAYPVAQTLRPRAAQDCAPCLWLVSHAVELCHVSGGGAGAPGDSGVSGDHAPLAP